MKYFVLDWICFIFAHWAMNVKSRHKDKNTFDDYFRFYESSWRSKIRLGNSNVLVHTMAFFKSMHVLHVNGGVSNTMVKRKMYPLLGYRRLQISSSCGLDTLLKCCLRCKNFSFLLTAIFSWLKMVGSACLCACIHNAE